MNILVLKPWLGVPFKRLQPALGINREDNLPPIRQHWQDFIWKLIDYLKDTEHNVKILDGPLWTFTPELIDQYGPDLVFIPHKNQDQFKYKGNARYYMQTVFPWLFTVNRTGWGGTSTDYPWKPEGEFDETVFNKLASRIMSNESKFDQPEQSDKVELPEDFIFFPGQIPHDETIEYHSDVTVEETLDKLSLWCHQHKVPLVVKGHPVNPGSMASLKTVLHPDTLWVDNVSIHDLLSKCFCVYTVNSGAGFEALLHKKPVVTFGQAEYDCVTIKGDINSLDTAWNNVHYEPIYHENVVKFFDSFIKNYCVDSTDINSYKNIKI